MLRKLTLSAAAIAALALTPGLVGAPAQARDGARDVASGGARDADAAELPAYLQCVPFARELTGVQIYGDAHTWWEQAADTYERGRTPKVGAVMAFRPHRNMTLGHVAAVSRIIDSRTVLLSHSNWSPIDGRRGQIERDVKAVDVSQANDWSEVRVWYDPIKRLGKMAWPVDGFIYNERSDGQRAVAPTQIARAEVSPARAQDSKAFQSAFANVERPRTARTTARVVAPRKGQSRSAVRAQARQSDPVGTALAKYD